MSHSTAQNSRTALAGQFPFRLLKNDPLFCEWMINTNAPFSEPFFDETLNRLKCDPLNQRRFKMLSHIDTLLPWSNGASQQPAAFIFHVSRCGSTLFSQLLGMNPSWLSLAEVPFFDELLRLRFKTGQYNAEQTASLFHAALQFYISSCAVRPSQVFIKSDSWHLHFYEDLREQYPSVPFILLYRHPLEVWQSQQRRRGIQSVPGLIEPAVFGFSARQAGLYDLDQYMGEVLYTYFKKMMAIATQDKHCILLNYNEGALAGMQKILAACGEKTDETFEAVIHERSRFHAKYPRQVFAEENAAAAIPSYLEPTIKLYTAIDEMRLPAKH